MADNGGDPSVFFEGEGWNDERVRFDIGGGNHRLIAAFDFDRELVFVKFLGSHAEYDRVDAMTVAWF